MDGGRQVGSGRQQAGRKRRQRQQGRRRGAAAAGHVHPLPEGRRWARCAEARARQRGTWWASPAFLGSLDASRPCRCGSRTCNAPQHLSCVRGENGSYADEREVPPNFT
eukprot:COSAG06_NODE_1383_length_9621_cov_17.241966_4_plen_109_part_00